MMRTVTLVFFLAAAGIFFTSIGGWDLKNPDEPRYAQVAREMMDTGQFFLPHINGDIYPDKPPLFFWMIAGASLPFGDVTAFSARFPAAFFGFCLILLTYFFARKVFDNLTALLAAVLLFSIEGFFKAALSVHFDSILAFFITASLFCFYCGYTEKKNRLYFLLSWVCMGLAVSTKGPVGLAIPLVSIIAYLLWNKDFTTLKRLSIVTGLLIVTAIVACWLVPACSAGGEDYINNIVLKQTFGRIVKSYAHQKPFYYYALKLPCHMLPWSLFIPGACYYFWQKRESIPEIRFPLIWFVASFVFLSMVSCKRGLYLLPLYPAATMLLAKFWRDLMCMETNGDSTRQQKLILLPALVMFGLLALAGIAVHCVPIHTLILPDISQQSRFFLVTASWMICFFGLAGMVVFFSRVRARLAFALLSCTMITLAVCAVFCIYPYMDKTKSAKIFAQRINAIVGPEDSLVASFKPELFNYYLKRYPIKRIENPAVHNRVEQVEPCYLLLLEEHYLRAPENFKKNTIILDRETVGHRTFYLAASRALLANRSSIELRLIL